MREPGVCPGTGCAAVVSPHLDDAAFSCPGRILGFSRDGPPPVLCTIFTRGSGDEPLRERIAEDAAASETGGFRPIHGPFADAPFRDEPRADFMSIVFGDREGDRALAQEIASWLLGKMGGASLMLAPLGVGRHADHRIVHEACVLAARSLPGTAVEFYEDRPYAFVDQAVEMRLAELGFDSRPDMGGFFGSLFRARYVVEHLNGEDAAACRAAYEATLRRGGRLEPLPESRILTLGDGAAAWEMVRAYESQLGAFTGGRDEFLASCRVSAGRMKAQSPYAERTWLLPR